MKKNQQIKLFHSTDTQAIEKDVNKWLEENNYYIVSITTSVAPYNEWMLIIITIIYEM